MGGPGGCALGERYNTETFHSFPFKEAQSENEQMWTHLDPSVVKSRPRCQRHQRAEHVGAVGTGSGARRVRGITWSWLSRWEEEHQFLHHGDSTLNSLAHFRPQRRHGLLQSGCWELDRPCCLSVPVSLLPLAYLTKGSGQLMQALKKSETVNTSDSGKVQVPGES